MVTVLCLPATRQALQAVYDKQLHERAAAGPGDSQEDL
jgi:hypothetical protein